MPTVVHYSDEGSAVATHADVFISVLRTASTMARLREFRAVAVKHDLTYKADYRSISVLEPYMNPISVPDDVRREAAALLQEFPNRGSVVVVEGGGFNAAALRTLIAGFNLIQRAPSPRKIVSRASDGVKWLLTTTSGSGLVAINENELLEAVDVARAAIGNAPTISR